MPPKRKSKPRSPEHAALGQAIELFIAETKAMSQDTVASDSGLSIRQVGRLTRGQTNPSYTTLLKLCDGLHVRLGTLMTRADQLRDADAGR